MWMDGRGCVSGFKSVDLLMLEVRRSGVRHVVSELFENDIKVLKLIASSSSSDYDRSASPAWTAPSIVFRASLERDKDTLYTSTPTPLTMTPTTPPTKTPLTQRLLQRAHSRTISASLYADKIHQKPLLLRPSTTPIPSTNARTHRQHIRALAEEKGRKRKRKPAPLSAKEKRTLGVYEIPKEERKYAIYEGLWRMWCAYIREILGITPTASSGGEANKPRTTYVTPASAGPMLASADFHGAKITCVRSRCAGRVGMEGIVVRDTKFTFVIVNKSNEVKTVPKEGAVFRFEVPLADAEVKGDAGGEMDVQQQADDVKNGVNGEEGTKGKLVFELHGEQFKNRAVDRANKKFKMHIPPDL